MQDMKMAELVKKAKLNQMYETKQCFGRAINDHKSISREERKAQNTAESRCEIRINKKTEKLSNLLEIYADKEAEYDKSRSYAEKHGYAGHTGAHLTFSFPAFNELNEKQLDCLRKILLEQRRYHGEKYAEKRKEMLSKQRSKVVNVEDVKAFLKVVPQASNIKLRSPKKSSVPTISAFPPNYNNYDVDTLQMPR